MQLPTSATVLFLLSGMVPLSGQGSGQELWRSALFAADDLKREGRLAESERMFRSALDAARQLEPDMAPAAATYHNLAGLYQDTGRCDSAARAYQRSVDLWEKVGARGETYLLRTANHLVGLYMECGNVQAAERHHRALVAPRIAGRAGRDRDEDVAAALSNLGSIDYEKRRYSDSRSHFQGAMAIWERISAKPNTEMAILLSNLGFALLRTGHIDEALAHSRRAIAMVESTTGPSNPLLVSMLVNGANLHLRAGRWSEAEPLLERALTVARNVLGEEHPMTATIQSCYADVLRGSHRKNEGEILETRVRAVQTRLLHSASAKTVDALELSLLNK